MIVNVADEQETPVKIHEVETEKAFDKRSGLVDRRRALRQLLCYVCCAEFGTNSLSIHHKTCIKKHAWGLEANILHEEGVTPKQAQLNRKQCIEPGDGPTLAMPSSKSSPEEFDIYNQCCLEIFYEHSKHCLYCREKNMEALEAATEAARRKQEDEMNRKLKQEEEEEELRRKLQMEEEEVRRKLEEDALRQAAADEAERRRLEAEAELRRLKAEKDAEEAKQKVLEEELARLKAEKDAEELRRKAAEDEIRRLQMEEEARLKSLEEAKRMQEEKDLADRMRREAELEAARKKAEEEAEEARRLQKLEEEAELKRILAEEEEQRRLAREEEERQRRLIARGQHKYLHKGEGHIAAVESGKTFQAKKIDEAAKADIAQYSLLKAKKDGYIHEPVKKDEDNQNIQFVELDADLAEKWNGDWSVEDEKKFSYLRAEVSQSSSS